MLLGYGTTHLFQEPPQKRDAKLLVYGLATAAFLVLRGIAVYGEPNPWQVQNGAIGTIIDFLNVTKYPPSLLFLLMTLGPSAILCAFADRLPRRSSGRSPCSDARHSHSMWPTCI